MIVSASRRTDIPAFHAAWMMERLRAGSVLVRNPFNARQVSRVSLSRQDAELIVFWTKDASNMLAHLDELDGMGHKYMFQYTLTPYGPDVEPGVDKRRAADAFEKLSARIGPRRTIWRYDPILLSGSWTQEKHIKAFEAMCRRLEGAAQRCVISFVDLYASVRRTAGWIQAPTGPQMHDMAREIAGIARRYGFLPSACAEAADFSADGLERRGCIDRLDVEAALGVPVREEKDAGQRTACRCIRSVDIGAYDTCPHGCVYCYARTGKRSIAEADVHSPILGAPLTGEEKITDRKEKPLAIGQISLFG